MPSRSLPREKQQCTEYSKYCHPRRQHDLDFHPLHRHQPPCRHFDARLSSRLSQEDALGSGLESHSLTPASVLGFLPYKSGLMYLMAYDAAKLLLDAHNLYARSASAYEIADVAVPRNHARLSVMRGALRRHA